MIFFPDEPNIQLLHRCLLLVHLFIKGVRVWDLRIDILGPYADISRVLCDRETRLGRQSLAEIKSHSFFEGVDWDKLHQREHPE